MDTLKQIRKIEGFTFRLSPRAARIFDAITREYHVRSATDFAHISDWDILRHRGCGSVTFNEIKKELAESGILLWQYVEEVNCPHCKHRFDAARQILDRTMYFEKLKSRSNV